ncbi:hypothetical protein HYPSUDRAFT_210114 [Hypholoma sublateritium FD-334 SS-4]|uniref:Uncharacterized protein n=1 Tax=Hypholoma sublateritium (strain FD-334 SS-4) TaxID=945553 RepID=A0A0D2KE46_HYPSF|nr:hypothetical protein HYPSUDRAFT_210114 [Hypholoma sublateritium FD-334 SS-4]
MLVSMHAESAVPALAAPDGHTLYGARNWIVDDPHRQRLAHLLSARAWGRRHGRFSGRYVLICPAWDGMTMDTTGALAAIMEGNMVPADVAACRLINLIV